MSDLFFVDSNLLVYHRDASEPERQPRAADWLTALWRTRRGRLSLQVLHEFYWTVTRRLRPGLSAEEAQGEVREYFAWQPVPLRPELLEGAWSIERRHRLSFWDSLIVSAAHTAGCKYLLTEDLQDGQDLEGLQVVNPFLRVPQQVGLS